MSQVAEQAVPGGARVARPGGVTAEERRAFARGLAMGAGLSAPVWALVALAVQALVR